MPCLQESSSSHSKVNGNPDSLERQFSAYTMGVPKYCFSALFPSHRPVPQGWASLLAPRILFYTQGEVSPLSSSALTFLCALPAFSRSLPPPFHPEHAQSHLPSDFMPFFIIILTHERCPYASGHEVIQRGMENLPEATFLKNPNFPSLNYQ